MSTNSSTLFSFRDPRAPQWALFILGLALGAAGALVGLVLVIEGMSKPIDGGLIGGLAFVGFLLLGGLFTTLYGLRDLVWSPEWRVTGSEAVRRRSAQVLRTVAFERAPEPTLTRVVRYGVVISVRVDFGGSVIVAPNLDTAQAIYRVWLGANT
jgi:hypothetical protein